MSSARNQSTGVGHVSLGTSAWNEWRPIHLSRADLLGYAVGPLIFCGFLFLPREFYPALGLVATLLSLVLIRNHQKPYFTSSHLHARRGWLGFTSVAIPLARIDDVVVEPVELLPGMGTINVKAGREYLEFQCVPEAERRADLLRRAVAEAAKGGRPQ